MAGKPKPKRFGFGKTGVTADATQTTQRRMPYSNDNIPFVRCKWTAGELRGKIVVYRLAYLSQSVAGTLQTTDSYKGAGVLVVVEENADHLIKLVIDAPAGTPYRPSLDRLPLLQRHVDVLTPCPEGQFPEGQQVSYVLYDDAYPTILD